MKYDNGSAFRRALEDRLRSMSIQTGMPLTRLRKMVAFDRYLARLLKYQPGCWILKGGLALQLRLGAEARTTKDIDFLLLDVQQNILISLRSAGALDLKDWFSFEVSNPENDTDEVGGKRYAVRAILDTRGFEAFHIDIGVADALTEPPDQLVTPELLIFAEIQPTIVPCYPIAHPLAEKLHDFTRLHASGESSRVKDFVDMLLMASLAEIHADRLYKAIETTFRQRGTHPLSTPLPEPPVIWV